MEKKRIRFYGNAISPGIGIGKVCVWGAAPVPQRKKIRVSQVSNELERLKKAIATSKDQLQELQERVTQSIGSKESEIFEAHYLFLDDPVFLAKIERKIVEQLINVESAIEETIKETVNIYSTINDSYLKERIQDIQDIGRRMLDNLLGYKQECLLEGENEIIVVTKELTASQLIDIDHNLIKGFVTEKGGATSHSAILARSLGIPLISGVNNITRTMKSGATLLINGFNGEIIRNPSTVEIRETEQQYPSFIITEDELSELHKLPTETLDGVKIHLYSNIRSNEDLKYSVNIHSEGIGLFRTEITFLNRKTFPTEEEQYNAYRTAVEKTAPNPVTIRTVDLGGDKFSPYFPYVKSHEMNPYLGLRAIRVSLSRPDVFRTQLRAILRASVHGKIKLMLPMISRIEEIKQTKRMLYRTMQELRHEHTPFDENLELGAMIEIPAAVIILNSILQEVDFISVGTNDLIQYTLAVDRTNERVSDYYDPAHPAILALLKQIIDAARYTKKEVSICGEMAADLQYVKLLLGLGYRHLSMSPFFIPQIKRAIRCIDSESAKEFAYKVLTLSEGKKIKKMLMDDLVCM